MYSIRLDDQGRLFYLDQTKLPLKEVWRECKSIKEGYTAIKQLRVRGAPLIGVFAAYCIGAACQKFSSNKKTFLKQIDKALSYLKTSRPTAINLFWALDRVQKVIGQYKDKDITRLKGQVLNEAIAIHNQDIRLCSNMATFGVKLIKKGDRILTHCNTGFLAASGRGTALSVIYKAHEFYKDIKVYVDETRPLLQGARLTAWELTKSQVPCTLISDNMAAYLMQKKEVDKVFLGADRITTNGDVANKIGTYSLAVLAYFHAVPFYVVAPFSTFDLKIKEGKFIPIEQREPGEVRKVLNKLYISPKKVKVYNPAFDVTPHQLISAIVTDRGILCPPFNKSIQRLIMKF